MYAAKEDAVSDSDDRVPPHLKDVSYGSAADKAARAEYKYPHDFGGYVDQQYLPDSLKDKIYYVPSGRGYEKEVMEIRSRKGKRQ